MSNLKFLLIFLLLPLPILAQDCSSENDGIEVQMSALHEILVTPFTTDLCTGYKEGKKNNKQLWADCCVLHDLRLWAGGDHKARVKADKMLYQCVRDKGAPGNAKLMWLGVKIGSLSPFKIKGKQWGNAWGKKVRREALTEDEINILETSLKLKSNFTEIQINQFIEELKSNEIGKLN